MISKELKKQAHSLVKIAKENGQIKKYLDFCDTDEAKKYALFNEEVLYYTSKKGCDK